MSKNTKPNRSKFAIALTALLDDTKFYKRAQWAYFLRISTSAISQWLNDKTLPRADVLAMVLDLLRLRGGEGAAKALAAWDKMASESATKVSPLGARMLPNVAAYLENNSFATLGEELRDAPARLQSKALTSGSWPAGLTPVSRKAAPVVEEVFELQPLVVDAQHGLALPTPEVERVARRRAGAQRGPGNDLEFLRPRDSLSGLNGVFDLCDGDPRRPIIQGHIHSGHVPPTSKNPGQDRANLALVPGGDDPP